MRIIGGWTRPPEDLEGCLTLPYSAGPRQTLPPKVET
jgi:hypothetical protein